jgi:peroxiredoxin
MKRPSISFPRVTLLAGAVFVVFAHGAWARSDGQARVGAAAPAFVLESAAGAPVGLEAFAGKPLVVNAFASWCPPCREELPRIAAAARATHGRFAFLGVDEQEPVEMGERFVHGMRLPFEVAFDHGQFAASYGVVSLPATIFIDKSGIVRAIHRGTIDARALAAGIAAAAK